MSTLLQAWALPVALLAIANISATWYKLVSENVPEPYLDEVFHVPQAQRYCNNDYTWDPKITTPPGLYLASLLLETVTSCETSTLRALNAGAICLICLLAYHILRTLRSIPIKQAGSRTERVEQSQISSGDRMSVLDAHSALNISLFPPLFFFSALYYTDVVSTLVVLLNYYAFIKRESTKITILGDLTTIVLGIAALLFRQTNIFWVAVFPAGLAVVDALKTGNEAKQPEQEDVKTILQNAWSQGQLYDCAVQKAGPQDYVLFLISTALTAFRTPVLVIRAVLPYLVLLAVFAGFVAWNGGVVLGDKSAHVATIHLPQMLYFWPYVIFFSIPLAIGLLLRPILPFLPGNLKGVYVKYLPASSNSSTPGLVFIPLFLLGGLAAVHYNTIIHPYTLADNRHYVFYVFRILRRHPAIKYLAVPLYYVCAWMTMQILGADVNKKAKVKREQEDKHPTNGATQQQSCEISFIVMWLAATALSVITAPLVEPRYFIIPWVMWRLHVPNTQKASYDIRLVLETIWLLAVNAAIGYNFLHHGFPWPSEPGKIQRFLW